MFYREIDMVKSSEMRKNIAGIILLLLLLVLYCFFGEIIQVHGSKLYFMGEDSVSWEQTLFHGSKYQRHGAQMPRESEECCCM